MYASYFKRKPMGGRTNTEGMVIHSYILKSPEDGTMLLKFIYCQLYNDNLTYRFKLAPTDACRYVDCRILAPISQVNAKPTTANSLSDPTQLANSPTQPLEPR